MQYHWTGQLGRAEEERARTSLNRAAAGIAADFDRELGRLFFHFLRPPSVGAESELAREVARWRAQPGSPELLRQLLLAESGGSPDGGLTLRAFDEAADAWRPATWPAELLPLRRQVESGRRGNWVVPAADVPALVVPVWPRGERDRDRGRRTGSREPDRASEESPARSSETPELMTRTPWPGGGGDEPRAFAILWLDTNAVADRVLPALVDRHLGNEVPYRVEVRDGIGPQALRTGPAARCRRSRRDDAALPPAARRALRAPPRRAPRTADARRRPAGPRRRSRPPRPLAAVDHASRGLARSRGGASALAQPGDLVRRSSASSPPRSGSPSPPRGASRRWRGGRSSSSPASATNC